jgi:hypothetical protein
MKNYEDQLDEIRIKLDEKTNGLEKNEIIRRVNSHAERVAREFGIYIVKEPVENYCRIINEPPRHEGRGIL